jgi:(1->4)-alpha-D-glucan 1-alpha-D-glucosylmutase
MPFVERLRAFAAGIARVGRVNSLAQLAIKLTTPGVPDFYQGTELWSLDLVDPDNRRCVDHCLRRSLLGELETRFDCSAGERVERVRDLVARMGEGRIKLYVTWRGLAARRARRALFDDGDYVALKTSGEHAERLCAFARVHGADASITVVPRLIARLDEGAAAPLGRAWNDTRVELPSRLAGRYVNVFTGDTVLGEEDGGLRVAEVFANFPVAILTRENAVPDQTAASA